jgi:filamentous hemagglutinin family protein
MYKLLSVIKIKYSPLLKYSIAFFCLVAVSPARGEIVPDSTMPVNSSIMKNGGIFQIDGGTQTGGNLFHSFQRFDVPTGGEAFFNNASNIDNILTRVTGGSVSNIDGILRANGNANLFLMNPNGIIFGSNASLKIGGSFFGSTASSIKFADGSEFSAINPSINPQAKPLLTVSVPVGLQFAGTPGRITVNGLGHQLSTKDSFSRIEGYTSNTGLRVKPGKTLSLAGGKIDLNGGVLTAEGGKIELGSVGTAGLVGLNSANNGLGLDYSGVGSFGDIQLSQKAFLDASGNNAGSIQVQGKDISLSEGSVFFIKNDGTQKMGGITVRSESLEIKDYLPTTKIRSGLFTETSKTGDASDITVSTGKLIVRDGGTIFSRTYGTGGSGQINLNATELLQLKNVSPLATDTFSTIDSTTFGTGKGGDIFISTPKLSVLKSGLLSTGTFGRGLGGNMTVNADQIEVVGKAPNVSGASGIATATRGVGNAGNLTLNTQILRLLDGGRLSTASFSSARAGDITVNASKLVEVNGFVEASASQSERVLSQIRSDVSSPNPFFIRLLGLPRDPSGNSGNVNINTPNLQITNEAKVSVSNQGSRGNAGDIKVNAGLVSLENEGNLIADSKSGSGGNIFVQSQDLRLRNRSNITTNANGSGTGGDIEINTETLAALGNSSITANSLSGFGGKVTINATGVFVSPNSKITATSAKGSSFNGTVNINSPDVDTSASKAELPAQPVDTSNQITSRCSASSGNNFVVSGNGGLPQNPTATLTRQTLWSDLRTINTQGNSSPVNISQTITPNNPVPMVEASGWVMDKSGQVSLVAHTDRQYQSIPDTRQCREF